MCNFNTKSRANAMQPIIFTIVVARNACAYNSGLIRCINNTEAITIKVNPVIKAKSTQNLANKRLPWPV